MSKHLSESELQFIVARVLECANDALTETENDSFTNGKKMAYYEILDTIKNELIVRDVNLKDFGLDINLEKLL